MTRLVFLSFVHINKLKKNAKKEKEKKTLNIIVPFIETYLIGIKKVNVWDALNSKLNKNCSCIDT